MRNLSFVVIVALSFVGVTGLLNNADMINAAAPIDISRVAVAVVTGGIFSDSNGELHTAYTPEESRLHNIANHVHE